MTPEQLIDLAERVEKEDVSWQLEREIGFAAGNADAPGTVVWDNGRMGINRRGSPLTPIWEPYWPPRFLYSLEEAARLLPRGWYVDVHDWTWSEEPCWCASAQRLKGEVVHISVKAKTEAQARVAIALRALAVVVQDRAKEHA